MTKVTKALLVAFGSAGLVGTGFAAWNITISGGTSANRTVTPNTDGDVVLVARGLLVSDVATSLTFHADTGTQVATYNVKAEDSDWYDNVDLLDASEEKVSLKVSFAGDSDTHEWSNYIALTEAVERTYSPSEWLEGKSSSGLDVSFTFNWVGLGVYANPKAYAQATYPTVESQQAYLEAVSAAIEGLQFTFSFDLVANEPATPPSPSVESVSATLSSASIEVGQTSTLTVNTNLANNVSGYSIVEDSGIPAVASFENGVFTGVSAGEVRFKVEIDSVKSSEVVLTVSEPAPVASITSVSVSPSEAEIEVGGNTTLTASVVKVGEISEAVTWSSDAEGVATVENGVVTGVGAGTAHITATSVADGTKSGSATITVVAATPAINYGTAESPLDVETAATTIEGLNLGASEWSASAFTIRGKVKEAPTEKNNRLNFHLVSNDGNHEVYCYGVLKGATNPDQNDIITVVGYVENYNSTLEVTGYPTQNYDYPTFSDLVRGTSSITVTPNHSTVTGIPATETNGEVVEFTVAADDGYTISSVKANNVTLTADNGTYSFTVAGNMSVVVTTAESGSAEPSTSTWTLVQDDMAAAGGTAQGGGFTWSYDAMTYKGWDNNKGIQVGSGNKPINGVWTVSTNAFVGKTISSITVNASIASSGNTSLVVLDGADELDSSVSLTTTATDYEFDASSHTMSGNLIIQFTNSAKAFYLKSIVVVYTD